MNNRDDNAGAYALSLLMLLSLFACCGIYKFMYDRTEQVDAMVSGQSWSRVIYIEDYQPRAQEGWDETVPSDAYDQSCYTRQRGSHRVKTGESCHTDSDGDRECEDTYTSVPDYDTYCNYTVDRWQYHRTLPTEGNHRERAYWAIIDFIPCPTDDCGCERESGRSETYTVYFTLKVSGAGGVKEFQCGIDNYDVWLSYRTEQWYTLQFGSIIPVPRCDTLQRREAVG